jgi:hypothetical protein
MPKVKSEPKSKKPVERKVLYPLYESEIRAIPRDENGKWLIERDELHKHVVTAPMLMEYFGFEEVTEDNEKDKNKPEPLFTDPTGRAWRLLNNIGNRPIDPQWYNHLKQEILNRQWRFNFEPMVFTKYGRVFDGQHQAVALFLAQQELQMGREADVERWQALWGNDLLEIDGVKYLWIEKQLCFGADEDPKVFQTMNTGKPRSISDVIYTSGLFKKSYSNAEMKVLADIAASAVRLMWYRTGHKADAFAPNLSHREATDFLTEHKKLIQCCEFIHKLNLADEDSGRKAGQVKNILSPGYAACAMYFMATCTSNGQKYHERREQGDDPTEQSLKFDMLKKAEAFWAEAMRPDGKLKPVRSYLGHDLYDERTRTGPNTETRMAVLCKAWELFMKGESIDKGDITVEFKLAPSGRSVLNEFPSFGGIDLGKVVKQKKVKREEEEEESEEGDDEIPEEEEDDVEPEEEEVKPKKPKNRKKKVEVDEDE